MKNELAVKQIYDDFISKVVLTESEKDVLNRYIHGDTYVNMAMETSQSYSSISRIIVDLKAKYELYKNLELTKLIILTKEKQRLNKDF